MNSLFNFLGSIAGRIFMVLVGGLLAGMIIALTLAQLKRTSDIRDFDTEMALLRVDDVVSIMNGTRLPSQSTHRNIPETSGTREAKPSDLGDRPDEEMAALLALRLASQAQVLDVQAARPQVCLPPRAMRDAEVTPRCWLVALRLRDGAVVRLAVNTPLHLFIFGNNLIEPIYVAILLVGLIVAAFFAARIAVAPLLSLSRATRELSVDFDAPPLAEHGPRELRDAGRAFNLMVDRLRLTLNERMQLLAAITHDLQTPLTRLRLRLEKVENEELRERLIADLAETQALINEGLDLARASHDPSEAPVWLNLDSLLDSIAEDDASTGRAVSLVGGTGCDVYARPLTLRRAVSNLIDNAVKYAGHAEIATEVANGMVVIHVRDRGPGLPPASIEELFAPFRRLETSRSRETGGTGLGLTIAKRLAEQNGGRIELRNRSGRGLDAMIFLPAGGHAG